MDEAVATDCETMASESQAQALPAGPAPRAASPPQPSGGASTRPKGPDESRSPRHSQRHSQRRQPHKKKQAQDDQSWQWTGSPIVASGPLSSLWGSRKRADEREKLSKTNVYLRGLPATITESELIQMCSPYGRVTSAKALVDKTYNRGYGFVDFEQSSSADTAVRELRSQGLFARMAKAVTREGRGDDPTNLYLANLPHDFSENHVECLLTQFGRITSARVLRDDAGRSRGVGFARMDSLASCERAIAALNGVCNLIPGRPLLVKFADSKKSPEGKSRARPAASPQMVWWPNSIAYPQLAVQTPPELQPLQLPGMQALHASAMQAPLQQHLPHLQAPMTQAPMASPALHPGALGQPHGPMGGHAVYMNYGYRYVSLSAPPLSSPPMMPLGSSMAECWSPGDMDGAALVDGLN